MKLSTLEKKNRIIRFQEKPTTNSIWINASFFVYKLEIMDHLKKEKATREQVPLENLTKGSKFGAFYTSIFGNQWTC